ncbi:MAG: vitamin K epoxide reductase family protein [Acidobacteriota bacterium]
MTPFSRKLLLAFGALGLAAASTSSYVHYRLLVDRSYTSFCDVNATVSCTQAYLSPYGSFHGVPVALGGVFFFSLVLLLAGVGGRERSVVRDSVPGYIFALSTIGLAAVLYLGWASYVQLKTFCLLCAITYVSVVALFVVSGEATSVPMKTLPGRVPRDFRALFSSPSALGLAALYLAGAVALLAYFPTEAPAAQSPAAAATPAPAAAMSDQQRADLAKWWDLQPRVVLPVPDDGAKVHVVIFSDYQCPHCLAAHEAYRPLIAKYAAGGQVKFQLRHFPLEGECNPHAPGGQHSAACEAAAAVVMARATGHATTMEDWLFANQNTLTPSLVREAAKTVGGIDDFNGGYAKALETVTADANLGGLLGVTSTPSLFLNGRKLPPGVIAAEYLDALIDLELHRTSQTTETH